MSEREVEDAEHIAPSSNASTGSSVGGVVFNFTNSIIGAGAIGLGGAISSSGGLISVAAILFFALLTKISLDLVIELSIGSSYEDLGFKCYGRIGWCAVLTSKMLYAFGCLVAYIVVVKDNFASALGHLTGSVWNDVFITLLLSTTVMLPLCLLRDMTALSNLSLISVASMGLIIGIVIYLYYDDGIRQEGGTVYEDWFQIRSGLLESLGTFVFSFVSQHTVHLAFESLKPELQTIETWRLISSWSIGIATFVSLSVGIFVYMTFWENTGSDLFEQYPALPVIEVAKLLLCITMLLTFPFPFFTCRDMMVVSAMAISSNPTLEGQTTSVSNDLDEPLLSREEETGVDSESVRNAMDNASEAFITEVSSQIDAALEEVLPTWLLPDRQLKLPFHAAVTVGLWTITTTLAIIAPNLGDVLNLVGCATGTVLAFILPSLFSFKLKGFSLTAFTLLLVGGPIGLVGSFFSVKKLVQDSI